MLGIRHERAMSHGAILFWGNFMGVLHEFMLNKKGTWKYPSLFPSRPKTYFLKKTRRIALWWTPRR